MHLYHNKFRLKPLLLPLFRFVEQYLRFNVMLDPIRDSLLDARLSKESFFLFWSTEERLQGVNEIAKAGEGNLPQGYTLDITADYVLLQAADLDGFFNGVQTLRQVLEQVLLGLMRQGGAPTSFRDPLSLHQGRTIHGDSRFPRRPEI